MSGEAGFAALRERAYATLDRCGSLSEADLLAEVYGGRPPAAVHMHLAAPLLGDPRLKRDSDGFWSLSTRPTPPPDGSELVVLALAATGPAPERARLVHVAALRLQAGTVAARFCATLDPGRRVPGYVLRRLGLELEALNGLPDFSAIAAELAAFVAERPVCAQDAVVSWEFVSRELRRHQQTVSPPLLIDVNLLAGSLLGMPGKPTLALVAQHLGVPVGRIAHPDEEARVLALVLPHLLYAAGARDLASVATPAAAGRPTLRQGETLQAQPEQPGVYVMRDGQDAALYVGKARQLRSRLAAYVHRPLGATRRFEGLVQAVERVQTQVYATDLEALVAEDHAIRALGPRFNTVRQLRSPRLWLRLPPLPVNRRGQRPRAPRRIELVESPTAAPGDYLGPFRNEAAAEQARWLARQAFDLDRLRASQPQQYDKTLLAAWRFLQGEVEPALVRARAAEAQAVAQRDEAGARAARHLLEALLGFDLQQQLLPADPRQARYAVVRPDPRGGLEIFVLDQAILVGWGRDVDSVLEQRQPRTEPADQAVVLRWLGAQRPPAQVVHLPETAAAETLEAAVLALATGEA